MCTRTEGLVSVGQWKKEGVVSDCPPSQAIATLGSSAVSPCKKIIPYGPIDYLHSFKEE